MDSSLYIFTVKRDGTILSLNHTSGGNPVDDIVGTKVFSHASPKHEEIMKEALERVFQTRKDTSYEILAPGPKVHDNQWYETILIPNTSGDRVETVTVIGRDITKHKRAEEALRESEEIYRSLVESSPNAITMSGLDGKIMQANRRAAEMLGLESEKELIGTIGYDLVVPEERENFQKELLASFKYGVSKEIEFTYIGKNNERRSGSFVASILRDAQGQPKAVMTTVIDVTERKQTEVQLKSLATQLSLAEEKERRRIATELHDNVGQILAAAKMKLAAQQGKLCTNEIEKNVAEAKRLCERAIVFTRSLTFQLSPPVLYELGLEPAVEWLAQTLKDQHGIRVDFSSDQKPKPLDDDIRVLLFQSIRELCNNVVRHAGAHKMKVSITREAEDIRVVVEDNGDGFDVSARGESDGFGLFNIRERLTSVGGTFALSSSPGQGTSISITAPLKSDPSGGH
jgi:PAS domain S-box-containing protein